MAYRFDHMNFNVIDLEASLRFYKKALELKETRRKKAADGSYIIVYLSDGAGHFLLELTWLRDWDKPAYDLGDVEYHLAFAADDFEAAKAKHEAMGCICYVNDDMGIYFVNDPDGYWIEIIPAKQG